MIEKEEVIEEEDEVGEGEEEDVCFSICPNKRGIIQTERRKTL